MFTRILVANRGEIALRIIRACHSLGIETVAVYSEVDEDSLHLRFADETICIGPGESKSSYLDIPRIIAAAEIADVEAIHPGYGFQAENAHFAEVCQACTLTFIGPPPEVIEKLGDKARAREIARAADVPVVPGSTHALKDDSEAVLVAKEIGYPVMIKAVAGGGGRGLRIAHSELVLLSNLAAARQEAQGAFGNGALYLEKFVERPRHVEIQILGDQHGHVVHLGERDCSLQRRHQKLLEEAPSPALSDDLRRRMGEAAVRLARYAGYSNAGTVEFLLDENQDFYFMEMNTRIQVEHPITEAVTGIDLVREQIRVAAGEELSFSQDDVRIRGHAIECRINAEDPFENFRPCPGKVGLFVAPGGPGVRVDSHLYSGYSIPPTYDSLVAKIISLGRDREDAINIMRRALDETIIEGVKTTLPLHRRIMENDAFKNGNIDTSFLADHEEVIPRATRGTN